MTKKSASAKASPAAEAGIGEEESVDKIRDILFGSQMRDYERKFSQLEERILKEVGRLRDEQAERLAALEQALEREMTDLVKRLDGEHDDRLAAEQDLAGTLAGLDETLQQATAELRQQLEQQARTLAAEIAARHAENGERLQQEAATLREQKVDRSALSELFNELAARLGGALPEGGGKA